MEPWAIILLVVVGLFALWLIVKLGMAAIVGAVWMFRYFDKQGYMELAVYIAGWVFLFPVMLVVSILVGLVVRSNKDD